MIFFLFPILVFEYLLYICPMYKLIFCIAMVFVFGCSTKEEKPNPQDDLETAQFFLQSFSKGNYELCKEFMLPNPSNDSLLNSQIKIFEGKTATQKKEIEESSIIIHNREEVSQTQTIITYNTSVNKTVYKLKLVKQETKWVVDFGYTFNGNL